jgi:hypothetical protein
LCAQFKHFRVDLEILFCRRTELAGVRADVVELELEMVA